VSAALAQVSELLFFLLGAMIVVEVVDAHDGFRPLAAAVRTDDRRYLATLVAGAAFFLSSVLDNLTTTIVVVSLLQRLVPDDRELRLLLGSITVVAANAGGAWTPIGDVTTTMLWIHGQVRGSGWGGGAEGGQVGDCAANSRKHKRKQPCEVCRCRWWLVSADLLVWCRSCPVTLPFLLACARLPPPPVVDRALQQRLLWMYTATLPCADEQSRPSPGTSHPAS